MLDKVEIAKMNARKQLKSDNIVIPFDEYDKEFKEHFKELEENKDIIRICPDYRPEDADIAYNRYDIPYRPDIKLEELKEYRNKLSEMIDVIEELEETFKYKGCEVGY